MVIQNMRCSFVNLVHCADTDALHRLYDKVPKINLSKSDRHNWHLPEQPHASSRDNTHLIVSLSDLHCHDNQLLLLLKRIMHKNAQRMQKGDACCVAE